LTGLAVREQADLIVWPETMYRWPLFVASPNFSNDDLRRIAPTVPVDLWRYPEAANNLQSISQMAGVPLIVGLDTLVADEAGFRHYNSAALVRPETGVSGRYDKMHRIAFGEYIPFKDWFPWLYRFTPFSSDFGLSAGARPAVFDAGGGRFAPIICYEDTVPHLVRDIVNSARSSEAGGVDCLVNLTNDGWFHGSSELDQHLITATFRCVETRTPMVRAVNTGISAIIDGDGVVVEPDVFIDADDQGRVAQTT
jgi:apolipoprotein N-acyltransferase